MPPFHAALGLALAALSATGLMPEILVSADRGATALTPAAFRRNVPVNAEPSAEAALRRGLGLLDAGEAAAAIRALEAGFGTPLDDLAHFSLGRALLQEGRAAEAAAQFAAVRTDPNSPWRPLAARLHPEALRAAGEYRAALRSYETLLDRYAELPDRPAVLWGLAQTWRGLGRERDEATVLADLVWEAPDAPLARAANVRLAELRAARVPVPEPTFADYLDRAAKHRYARRYAAAHADIDAAEALAGRGAARRQRIYEARAATWERSMDWAAIIADLEPRLGQKPEEDAQRALLLATALRRSGRVDDGLALLARLARKTRHVTQRDMAAAYLEEGRIEDAERLYEKILRRRRARPTRSFEAAWLEYRLGNLDAAVAGFAEVARRSRGRSTLKADYWHARSLMDAGRSDEAVPLLQSVAERAPEDYYAYLARSRLLDLGQPDAAYAAAAERLGPLDQVKGGRAAPAARTFDSVPRGGPPAADGLRRAEALYGDLLPRLSRALLLHDLGRIGDARRELRYLVAEIDWVRAHPRAVSRIIGRPISPFLDRRPSPAGVWGEDLSAGELRRKLRRPAWKAERARLVAVRDLPREVHVELREALRAVDDAWGVRRTTFKLEWYSKGVPDAENRRYYQDTNPLAWRPLVEREAAKNGLDPALVWAIMTVESAYNETAHSVANARGLLQLLPRTAGLVASALGEPAPHPSDLLEPARNIRFGVWYLARLADRFQGQELLAAAAYNAGPHRIAWLVDPVARQRPFDVVLEDLPAWGGREYAKKVLGFIGRYRRVYLDDPVVYVGNAALPSVPGINY